jgi:hypothetical protein
MMSRKHGRQLARNHTSISRLVAKHGQTNNVKNIPRPDRPRETLLQLIHRNRFMSSILLKANWILMIVSFTVLLSKDILMDRLHSFHILMANHYYQQG